MSCNHCSTVSTAPAAQAGAPDIEAAWSANRGHPQFCPKCGAFLRTDGGCTKCESYAVQHGGQSITLRPVSSSAAHALGYDHVAHRMAVEYVGGQVYVYDEVTPGEFNEVITADSIGRALQPIRGTRAVAKLGAAADISQPVAPTSDLASFLRDPERLKNNAGLGSAAIAQLAQEIRAGTWQWQGDPPQYPNIVPVLSDPNSAPHISPEDRDTVLRSYRPQWFSDTADYLTDPEALPLYGAEGKDKTLRGMYPQWYEDVPRGFQAAVMPAAVEQMSRAEATLALERVFQMAQAGEWRRDNKAETTWQRLTGLYAKADLSRLDAETVAAGYNDILSNSTTAGARDATLILVGNPTAPARALELAAEEVGFDGNYNKTDATMLATHPNLDLKGQEWLATSPDPAKRHALTLSPTARGAVLERLMTDPSERVALTALRNGNNPHSQTAEKNRAAGITDAETLRVLNNKRPDRWKLLPRCGQCGTWTKKDGVCANKRCGGVGRVMAAVGLPAQQGAFRVAAPLRRKLTDKWSTRNAIESTLKAWQEARDHGTFPDEWKAALPAAISELAATNRWQTPTGDTIVWKDGHYQLHGVPFPARTPGEVVKGYFAMLDSASPENKTVTLTDKTTGEQITKPRWRYSEGYNAVVAHDVEEPDLSFIAGRAIEPGEPRPATPPVLPSTWKQTLSTRGLTVYDGNGQRLIAHGPDSQQYACLKEGDAFTVSGQTLRHIIDNVGRAADASGYRPAFQRVWGLPAELNSQRDMVAPHGVWAAADGYRLMVMAHDGEPITSPVNVHPALKTIIPAESAVTAGSGGLAFRAEGGHLLEAEADPGTFPDYNRIIPGGQPAFSFRLTQLVPPAELKRNSAKLGKLTAAGGEVFIDVTDDDKNETSRVKVGESDDKGFTGHLAGVNMGYLNDVLRTQPPGLGKDKGSWEVGVFSATSPLVVKHSSRKAKGAIMPMHIQG